MPHVQKSGTVVNVARFHRGGHHAVIDSRQDFRGMTSCTYPEYIQIKQEVNLHGK